MSNRVYRGPEGSPDINAFDRAQALFKQFDALDEAPSSARHVETLAACRCSLKAATAPA
jgi:hypothetical protein